MRVLVELEQLREDGVLKGITHVIDVGAHEGLYAEAAVHILPDVHVLCFEPAPAAFSILQQRFFRRRRHVECFQCALGAEVGTAELNISGFDQASSLIPMTSMHTDAWRGSEVVRRVEVDVRRLDGFLALLDASARVFVKIDAQGFEKNVIQGGGETLKRVSVIQIEVSLMELYVGSPLLPEMMEFMSAIGYDLYDVIGRVVDPRNGQTLQLDLVFTRRDQA